MEELMQAIRSGDVEAARHLVTRTPQIVEARNEQGVPAVRLAAYFGHPEIARLLIARGARLSVFDAAAMGDVETLRKHLADAPESIRDYSEDGWTPLHLAAFFGHPEAARMLLESGADPHAFSRNHEANTPLHAACAGRRAAVVAVLVEHGADPDRATETGLSARKIAEDGGDAVMLRALAGKANG